MKNLLTFILWAVTLSAVGQTKSTRKLQGTWINDKDSLSSICIADKEWILKYEGVSKTEYEFQIINKLPACADSIVKTEFIMLTNKTDTTYFELLGVTKTTLSLMRCPTGGLSLFNKKIDSK